MRNIILVAILIALATVVGCKPKEPKPTENTMNSMDMKSAEQPGDKMQQSPEAAQDPAAAAEAPASGDGAGSAQ
ncbi:hypothetical protein [Kaarinaea lacus]